MRPLTEEELKAFFEKLAKYIGRGIKSMLQRPDGAYCFCPKHAAAHKTSAIDHKAHIVCGPNAAVQGHMHTRMTPLPQGDGVSSIPLPCGPPSSFCPGLELEGD